MTSTITTNQKDYRNAAYIGLLIGVFLIPTIRNLKGNSLMLYIASILFFPIGALVGMLIAKSVFERFTSVFQFIKFGLTGTSNTAINLGVVNIFVLATGITAGLPVILFSAVAFVCSLSNSYFWNANWAFKATETETKLSVSDTLKKILIFAIITAVGIAINSGVVYAITRITPPAGLSGKVWIDIASLVATFVVLFWNFFGFKKIVFRPSEALRQ